MVVLSAVCWNSALYEWSMKEGRKTMMLDAVRAEAVRIHNGSNHHLLKFALICSLHATGSRRLVSIFSYGLRSGLSCVEQCFTLFEHGARYLNAYSATYTKQPGRT